MIRLDIKSLCLILERVSEDTYILCETGNGIVYPVEIRFIIYDAQDRDLTNIDFKTIETETEHTFGKTTHEDLFIFTPKGNIEPCKFAKKRQILLDKIYGEKMKIRYWFQRAYCLELSESSVMITAKELQEKAISLLRDSDSKLLGKYVSIKHSKYLPKEYSINKCIDSIQTTYLYGVGLNKVELNINGKTIYPGGAIVINSSLTQNNAGSICDLSLFDCRNKYRFPRKYTKQSMNLGVC